MVLDLEVGSMNMTKNFFKAILAFIEAMTTFVFVFPVYAANRNDVLFNLKDTFNSPVDNKMSAGVFVFILLMIALIYVLVKINSSKTRKDIQISHELYVENKRSQQQTNSNQKRNWFRLQTNDQFEWIHSSLAHLDIPYHKDRLVDISGGGLCFSTSDEVAKDDEIRVFLNIGGRLPLALNGQVTRVTGDGAEIRVSIKFIGIRDGQRDRIISWILKNQRSTIVEEKDDGSEKPEGW